LINNSPNGLNVWAVRKPGKSGLDKLNKAIIARVGDNIGANRKQQVAVPPCTKCAQDQSTVF